MDERLDLWPPPRGREDGPLCAEFGISRKTATRFSGNTKITAWGRSTIGADVPSPGQPLPPRWRRRSASEARVSGLGCAEDPRESCASVDDHATCAISTVHAVLDRHGWCSAPAGVGGGPWARSCSRPTERTPCGARLQRQFMLGNHALLSADDHDSPAGYC